MRWHEIVGESLITELFNSSVDYEWTEQSHDVWSADFNVDGLSFTFGAEKFRNTETWDVEFAVDNRNDRIKRGTDVYGSTGATGFNSVHVFSTVLELMREWVKGARPQVVTFSGSKGNGKDRLYRAMVSKMAPEIHRMGYQKDIQDGGDKSVFVFKRVNEDFDDLTEHASAGATGSGNVATSVAAVGGLGAGFDPDGDWGIYQSSKPKGKKPTVMRR